MVLHIVVMLHSSGVIEADLAQRMQAMVGFRNIAVHDYQAVNLEILRAVIEKNLSDLQGFVKAILVFYKGTSQGR